MPTFHDLIAAGELLDEDHEPRRAPKPPVTAKAPRVDSDAKAKNRRKHLRSMLGQFGYTEEKYAELLRAQHGVCAICDTPPAKGEHLVIDHCHVGGPNGRLRQLLCQSCNKGLGNFGDNPSTVDRAAAYLRRWRRLHGRDA